MARLIKNSLKKEVLQTIYDQKLLGGFTSTNIFAFLGPKLFSPKAVEMGLMRYAKHGLLTRKRIGGGVGVGVSRGDKYHYYPNDNTYRAYCYYFGHPPAGVPVPLSVGLHYYLQGGLASSSSSSSSSFPFPPLPPPLWTPSSKDLE
jgi:hypothetical protein